MDKKCNDQICYCQNQGACLKKNRVKLGEAITRLPWHDYWMSHALLAAFRSPDPSTQVGCILVKDQRMVGMGYNGYPRGVEPFTWERDPKAPFVDDKYHDMDFSKAARKLLRAANVPFTQYDGLIEKLWIERRMDS